MTSQDSGPMSSLDGPEEVGPVRPAAERMAENLERETQLGPHFWSILGAAVAVFLVGALVAYLVLRPRSTRSGGS